MMSSETLKDCERLLIQLSVFTRLNESDAKTYRTPKHLVRNPQQGIPFFAKLWECARVFASLLAL